jgi:hypothetical protein
VLATCCGKQGQKEQQQRSVRNKSGGEKEEACRDKGGKTVVQVSFSRASEHS